MLGKPFHRAGWVYDEKYDGWRMLAFQDGRRVRLISVCSTGRYPTNRVRVPCSWRSTACTSTVSMSEVYPCTDGATCSSRRSAAPAWCSPLGALPENGHAAWNVVKERGHEGLVAKDAESTYRGGLTRSWVKVKIRHEGRFILGAILGLPYTFAGILVGQRVGGRLLYRGTV